jgi:conflict system STAND superfamily ATPase
VRGPAVAAGLVYETDATHGTALDEQLLGDADRPDLLPLLQFTLNQLFEVARQSEHPNLLSFAAYRALGGLEGAVDKEAESALRALSEAERARLPRLLRELVVPVRDSASATSVAFDIRSAPLTDAAHDESSARLVRALVDARILLLAGERKAATVRLAHARVLDAWQRAKSIVAENADFYRIRADVDEQRRRWEAAGRSRDLLIGRGRPLAEAESIARRFAEEIPAATRDFISRSGKRARIAQTLTAAAAVLFALAAGVAVYAAQRAVHAQQEAEEQHARVEETFAVVSQIALEEFVQKRSRPQDLARAQQLAVALKRLNSQYGTGWYYDGQIKRARDTEHFTAGGCFKGWPNGESGSLAPYQDDFFRYLEMAKQQPAAAIGNDMSANTCYQNPAGFCLQRIHWTEHLLANDFYQQAQELSGTDRLQALRAARRFAAAARGFADPAGLGGFVQCIPTMVLLDRIDGLLAQPAQ